MEIQQQINILKELLDATKELNGEYQDGWDENIEDGEKLLDYLQNKIKKVDISSERIICAAIWYKDLTLKKDMPIETYLPKNIDRGVVFTGHRHGQCIYTKCAITGLRDAESGEHEQGFLTSKNRFVSREDALKIALEQNQIIDHTQIRGNKLYSEDLY